MAAAGVDVVADGGGWVAHSVCGAFGCVGRFAGGLFGGVEAVIHADCLQNIYPYSRGQLIHEVYN